jgi:hypothetical protein
VHFASSLLLYICLVFIVICHHTSFSMHFQSISETFLQSPLHWYLIPGRQKTSFLDFIYFRTFWIDKNRGKIPDQFFNRRRTLSKRSTRGELRGPNGPRWHALHVWARHPSLFASRASSWPPFYTRSSVSPKNLSHIFPETY